ncbi:MAG: GNAT family N-acetyltransferase [Treponema sp.]|mgnify:FL=1|nr:GNAT family N-acetyltransferase [Treponema sp.]
MQFELTESLIESIIFSMEDQNSDFALDADSGSVVPLDSLLSSQIDELEAKESLYPLPSWTSDDGFEIMEKFAEGLRIPKIQGELLQVLANGRGVFRNFKNVLKQFPHIEKRFQSFKKAKMRSVVVEWYNSLRESWGLEKLSQDFEDYNELTQEDFEFRPYNHQKDSVCVITEAKKIAEEIKTEIQGEAANAIAHFWLRKFDSIDQPSYGGIMCRTLSDEFAGCFLFSDCKSFALNTVALTAVFVNQNYRGLGITRELFSRGISYLKEQGIQSLIIVDSVLPDYLEPLLARCGFEKKGSAYVLGLHE